MCSLTKYVFIGGLTAVAAATATGSDLTGWIAGALAVGLTAAAGRLWPASSGGGSCTLPAPPPAATRSASSIGETPAGGDMGLAPR
jgi:hypothetical protein